MNLEEESGRNSCLLKFQMSLASRVEVVELNMKTMVRCNYNNNEKRNSFQNHERYCQISRLKLLLMICLWGNASKCSVKGQKA